MTQQVGPRVPDANSLIEAMSKLLGRFAAKGKLPYACHENKWGIDVLYSKASPQEIMFHFVTKDDLEVGLDFDFDELNRRGNSYIESLMELLTTQLEVAHKERQRERSLLLLPAKKPLSPGEEAIAKAVLADKPLPLSASLH